MHGRLGTCFRAAVVGHGLDSLVGIVCRQTDGDGAAQFERSETDGLGYVGVVCVSIFRPIQDERGVAR